MPAVACAAVAAPQLGALLASPHWDYVCAVLTAIIALAWVKLFDVLAGSGVLDQVRSRRVVRLNYALGRACMLSTALVPMARVALHLHQLMRLC